VTTVDGQHAAPQRPSTELAALAAALHAQWTTLRRWVGEVVDADAADVPSVLDGWTVAELVAHLGRAMSALGVCEPAATGTVPLTLAEYLGSYADRAQDIAATTVQLAREIAHAPLPQVDAMAADAFARLDTLGPGDVVVLARRGPVLLSDMVTSRLIELVVHADDLQRSLDRARRSAGGAATAGARTEAGVGGDGPIDRAALDLVAAALLQIVVARGGWSLEVVHPLRWVRLAAGRAPYDVAALADALAPAHTSDAVPDLGRMLPIL